MNVRNGYVTRLTPRRCSQNVVFRRSTLRNWWMSPKKGRPDPRNEPALPFDVTQEIDPALVADLRRGDEATLTQTDFEEITLVLPENRKPRA